MGPVPARGPTVTGPNLKLPPSGSGESWLFSRQNRGGAGEFPGLRAKIRGHHAEPTGMRLVPDSGPDSTRSRPEAGNMNPGSQRGVPRSLPRGTVAHWAAANLTFASRRSCGRNCSSGHLPVGPVWADRKPHRGRGRFRGPRLEAESPHEVFIQPHRSRISNLRAVVEVVPVGTGANPVVVRGGCNRRR